METNVLHAEHRQPVYTEAQTKAFGLYLRQFKPAEIAAQVQVATRTVQLWASKFGWKEIRDDVPLDLLMRERIAYLMWIEEKHDSQLKELEMLLEQKRKRDEGAQKSSGARFSHKEEKRGRKPNKVKNDVSHITKEMLDRYREWRFHDYQKELHTHKCDDTLNHFRFYLKSRQIGLTYYFAYEAFEDAVLTGDNQVFLSASRKQSEIFKNYIRKFALEIGDVDLKGKDELILSNGAEFHFLSTNATTSQGYNGHLYFDETFWIPKFKELDNYAGGMSIRGKYRTTYLSTPSTIAHEAYPKWQGDKALKIDISHAALKDGALGPDGIFRQIITIDDAMAKGASADFNLERLHQKYPDKVVFDNLLRCVFLDDSASVFAFKALLACKVDASIWADVDHEKPRPVGDTEVLVGYDPRGGGQGEGTDDAGLVVSLKPKHKGGVFRLIERLRLKGSSYEEQAQVIRGITEKYNVVYLAMDTGGVGSAVAELVRKFYPALTELNYSPEVKRMMVYKAREVINNGRLLFDGEWDDLVHSFLMIRQHTTKYTNQVTYISNRNKAGSHGDLAWASMHIMSWEPIDIHSDDDTTVDFF
ncbi:terminase large subunit domain-containing protein [Vibrio furnissii]|uniref:terminase large subunit domain-containing protein n=1 Tax=Vibrio furnissii TaxID=29494 RepID=UPI00155995AD|nr:terminase family protein [Vibrio furnissii]